MSHDKIGPKERRLLEMREARYQSKGAGKKPSAADLRTKIAKIKPPQRKGGRGR